MDAQRLIKLRYQKDKFFKEHEQSPLNDAQKAQFKGLNYFIAMPKLDMVVEVHPFEERTDVKIQTTTGQTRWYRRWGEFHFTIGHEEARLTIYQTPHGFFLPFVDALAGEETYPAGRYLEPIQLDETHFQIDFNQAYNPYCAYSAHFDCPITPAENRLQVPIRAGEKIPEVDWVNAE
jgi:uncharacterized protein (DUF1684 family)